MLDCGQNYSTTDLKVQASFPTHGRIHCNAIQGSWSFFCNLWLRIQGNASATSIVEPRYPCYCNPEVHAQFSVLKVEPGGPRLGQLSGPVSIPLPLKSPPPMASRWGCFRNKKAPSHEGASFISLAGTRAHVKGVASLIFQPK